jgi:CheY-like chemotaxis protein
MSTKVSRDSVLIIDDDPYLRELVEAIGLTCNVPVLQASDCGVGLKILANDGRKIKMILLDYFMPGMQPIQCAGAIMEKAGSSIPVVLITAAIDPSLRAAELKINRWISKPFDVSALAHLMSEKPVARKLRR